LIDIFVVGQRRDAAESRRSFFLGLHDGRHVSSSRAKL
jgi:hypothetical protein